MCIAILLFASNNIYAHRVSSGRVSTINFEILTNSQNKPLHCDNTIQASSIFEVYAIGYKNKTNIFYSNDWNFYNTYGAFVKVSNKEKINIENFKKKIFVRNKT